MKGVRAWNGRGYDADDTKIICVVALIFLFCLFALWNVGVNGVRLDSYYANSFIYLAAFVILVSIDLSYTLWISRPERPIRFLRRYFLAANHGKRIVNALPMIAALVIFMPVFSAMKSSIPLFTDYSWDNSFIAWDRAIHGTDPWKLLQPVLGFPIVTSIISVLYHLWILLIYIGGIYFAIYEQDPVLRRRYFASFFGLWVICGIVLAITFASVGPCFVGPLFDIHVFDEQMAYLNGADQRFPVLVLDVQNELLGWYRTGSHGLGRGITAMPSMHVALAFLFFLAMRRVWRWAGYLFGGFFAVILIGSVHLAYHYAVDGYVAVAVTLIVWKLAGKWAQRKHRTRPDPADGTDGMIDLPIRDPTIESS